MWLFFGCRQNALDLYREEKAAMVEEGVLDKVFLALSREPSIPKVNNPGTICHPKLYYVSGWQILSRNGLLHLELLLIKAMLKRRK